MKSTINLVLIATVLCAAQSCKKDTAATPATQPAVQLKTSACTTPPQIKGVVVYGGIGAEYVHSLKLDAAGNLLVTGRFAQTVDFNPGSGVLNLTSPNNKSSVYTQKFSPSGNFISATNDGLYVEGALADGLGYEYISIYEGDPGPVNSPQAVEHFLVKRKKSTGEVAGKVSVGMGIAQMNGSPQITIDKNLNVLASSPDQNLYKFNKYGKLLWKMPRHITNGSYLKVDNAGAIYELSVVGDPQLAKYDNTGNRLWDITLSAPDIVDATSDTDGNTYITGSMRKYGDVDPGPGVVNLNYERMYLLKLSPEGKFVWAVESKGAEVGPKLVLLDATGTHIVVAGRYNTGADFSIGGPSIKKTSNGKGDIFVMLLKQCK